MTRLNSTSAMAITTRRRRNESHAPYAPVSFQQVRGANSGSSHLRHRLVERIEDFLELARKAQLVRR